MSECIHKNELHWHVTPCKHGQWPQMFCKNCNGVYAESVQEDIKLEGEHLTSRKLAQKPIEGRKGNYGAEG